MAVKNEIVNYKDFGKCIRLSNDAVELIVSIEFGPRILRYGFIDGENILNDNKAYFEPDSSDKFQKFFGEGKYYKTYGGHRLWTAPEFYPEMYYPDNDTVEYELTQNGVILTPPPQNENGIQMRISITLDDVNTDVTVEHTITNFNERIKEFSAWALTVGAKGGTEIIPLNTNDTHLLPNGKIAVWPYTDLRKKELYLGKKYVTIRQPKEGRIKLGFDLRCGTVYYVLGNSVFTKKYNPNYPTGNYVDGGVSYETYSCDEFTELETLSELKKVACGQTIEHTEYWSLSKKPCEFDPEDDTSIDNFISKL